MVDNELKFYVEKYKNLYFNHLKLKSHISVNIQDNKFTVGGDDFTIRRFKKGWNEKALTVVLVDNTNPYLFDVDEDEYLTNLIYPIHETLKTLSNSAFSLIHYIKEKYIGKNIRSIATGRITCITDVCYYKQQIFLYAYSDISNSKVADYVTIESLGEIWEFVV